MSNIENRAFEMINSSIEDPYFDSYDSEELAQRLCRENPIINIYFNGLGCCISLDRIKDKAYEFIFCSVQKMYENGESLEEIKEAIYKDNPIIYHNFTKEDFESYLEEILVEGFKSYFCP